MKIKSIYWARKQGKPKKDFYYIDTTAIDNINQSLSENIEKISLDKAPSRARKKIEFGDILFGTVRPYLKNIAIFDKKSDYYVASTAFVVMTPILVKNNFLVYSLLSPKIQTIINQKTTGSNYPAINDTNFQELFIPIPPLQEQVRINNKISELLKRIKQYSYWYSLLDILYQTFPEKLRKSILQYAMQGKLVSQDATDEPVEVLLEKIREEKQRLFEEGKLKKKDLQESIIYQSDDNSYYENQEKQLVDIPKSWKWVNIKTIAFITMGQSPKSKDVFSQKISNSIEFHQGKSFFGKFNLEESKTYTTNLNKLINKPSVLLSVRAPVGDVNYVNRPVVIGRGLAAITCYKGISISYLFNYLFTQKNELESIATGSTFKAINSHIIHNILVPLPPSLEQERIVYRTEKILMLISKLS